MASASPPDDLELIPAELGRELYEALGTLYQEHGHIKNYVHEALAHYEQTVSQRKGESGG